MKSHFHPQFFNDDVRKQASSCNFSLHIKWSQWWRFGIRRKWNRFSRISNHRFTNKEGKPNNFILLFIEYLIVCIIRWWPYHFFIATVTTDCNYSRIIISNVTITMQLCCDYGGNKFRKYIVVVKLWTEFVTLNYSLTWKSVLCKPQYYH